MKYYQLLIKVNENGQDVYKPLKTSHGAEYLYPSEDSVKRAYQSLYYQQNFIPFEDGAKIGEIELTNTDKYCCVDAR